MRKLLLLILSGVLLLCCAEDRNEKSILSDFNSPLEITKIGSIKMDKSLFSVSQILKFKDWIVIKRYGADTYLHTYNINSGQEVNFVNSGRADIEVLNVSYIRKIDENTLWVDCEPNKVMLFDVRDFESGNPKPKQIHKLNLSAHLNTVQSGNSLIYMSSNLANNTTLYYAQTLQGDTIKYFGEYPPEDEQIMKLPGEDYTRSTTYQGKFGKHPSKDLAVYAPIYAQGFDIIDTKKLEIKERKFYAYPTMELIQMFDANFVKAKPENKGGFPKIYCNDKYIYALYVDNDPEIDNSTRTRLILVYDWDGDPVRSYRLHKRINGFTISDDNKTMYALQEDELDNDRVSVVTYSLE